jgi:O-antigen polymerase
MPTFFQITQPDISGLNDIDSAMIRNKFNFIGLLGIYFIVVMHIYIKNNGGIGFTFPANITGMIFIAIFIISILWQTRRFSSIQVSRALPYVVAGVVLLILPVFWSENPWRNTALLRFLVLLTGLCFYFLLLQCKLSRQDKIKVLTILLLAVSTEALLGMVQYYVFAPDNFMRYNTLINRPYGIFQHVNVMASFMATGMVIALYLWQQNTISRRVRQLAGLVLVLTPCLLVLSGSRIGLLTVLIISPLQIRFILCNNRLSGFKAIGLIITGIAGAIFSLFVINGGRPLEQFSDVHDRLIAWEISLKMFSMKPLTGWG